MSSSDVLLTQTHFWGDSLSNLVYYTRCAKQSLVFFNVNEKNKLCLLRRTINFFGKREGWG